MIRTLQPTVANKPEKKSINSEKESDWLRSHEDICMKSCSRVQYGLETLSL